MGFSFYGSLKCLFMGLPHSIRKVNMSYGAAAVGIISLQSAADFAINGQVETSRKRVIMNDVLDPAIVMEFDELVRRNRRRCLWFMRDDYAPVDAAGMLKVLRNLEQHGDRETFIQARRLTRCLSQHSNAVCARS
jgi:hypothetical protein